MQCYNQHLASEISDMRFFNSKNHFEGNQNTTTLRFTSSTVCIALEGMKALGIKVMWNTLCLVWRMERKWFGLLEGFNHDYDLKRWVEKVSVLWTEGNEMWQWFPTTHKQGARQRRSSCQTNPDWRICFKLKEIDKENRQIYNHDSDIIRSSNGDHFLTSSKSLCGLHSSAVLNRSHFKGISESMTWRLAYTT